MVGMFPDTVIDDNFRVAYFSKEPVVTIVDSDDDCVSLCDVLSLECAFDDLLWFREGGLGEECVENSVGFACLGCSCV
jgi:hypothetical protein